MSTQATSSTTRKITATATTAAHAHEGMRAGGQGGSQASDRPERGHTTGSVHTSILPTTSTQLFRTMERNFYTRTLRMALIAATLLFTTLVGAQPLIKLGLKATDTQLSVQFKPSEPVTGQVYGWLATVRWKPGAGPIDLGAPTYASPFTDDAMGAISWVDNLDGGYIYRTYFTVDAGTNLLSVLGATIPDDATTIFTLPVSNAGSEALAFELVDNTFLDAPVNGHFYVNIDGGIDTNADLIPDIDNNDGLFGIVDVTPAQDVYYGSIQQAVNGATSGDEIDVPAGMYAENVFVDKQLDIRGPNYSISPNGGLRVAEAVIVPPTTDPDPNSLTSSPLFYLDPAASGTSIQGFTIDGDNPDLSGGWFMNSADVDGPQALAAYEGMSDLTFQHNIVQNLTYGGLDLYNYYNGGAATTTNLVNDNLFDNIVPTEFGIGVLIYNNCYTDITNNVMTRVRIGVQTGNFYQADLGSSHSIAHNKIESSRLGIFHNVAYGTATTYEVHHNTITTVSGSTDNNGILISSIEGDRSADVHDNSITGAFSGYNLWNNPTSATVTIIGGSATDCVYGVFANNYDGYSSSANSSAYIVRGMEITGSTGAGVYVKDNPLDTNNATVAVTVTDDTEISQTAQTATGILVEGSSSSATITGNDASIHGFAVGIDVNGGSAAISTNHIYDNGIGVKVWNGGTVSTLDNNNFAGAPDNGTDLQLLSTSGTVTMGSGNAFAGETYYIDNQSSQSYDLTANSTTYDEADNFDIEDRMYHALDNAASGLVTVVANNDYVSTPGTGASDETIQRAINAASNGWTVNVAAGTFAENVEVNKTVTVQGAGAGSTIVVPAISQTACGSGSICPGSSNVILIEADNVVIKDLTVDGNNPDPLITSGVTVGGSDIDARNGIITNHTVGAFTGLEVAGVTVQNIFLRGIYNSTGTTFNFHDNTVTNVQGDAGSIGMFTFGGSGEFANNVVSDCNDAIAANQGIGAAGIQIYGNTVTNSASGIHADNWNGPGTLHIHDNNVSAGVPFAYGIWAYATYYPVLIEDNTVSGVNVGLMHAGAQAPTGVVTFSGNEVSNCDYGFYQTTDLFYYPDVNVSSVFSNNALVGCTVGLELETTAGGLTRTLVAHQNSITGSTPSGELTSAGTDVDDLTCNYWGTTDAGAVAATLPGLSNYLPFDNDSTDISADPGYQPSLTACGGYPVTNLNTTQGYMTIQAAVDVANPNDVIEASAFTFNERVVIDRSLTLQGVSEAGTILDGTSQGGNGKGITINTGVTGVTIRDLTVRNYAGSNGNSDAGIFAIGGNDDLLVEHVTLSNNVGGSGFYANGPIDNVTLDYVTSHGHTSSARGIVIWNGVKSNITITNCEVYNNNCCGIELSDGTATGVTIQNNNVHDNTDNGIGLVGLTGPGANLIQQNTLLNNGRFGIEIKNPNGSGATSGPGSVVVDGNNVSRTVAIVDVRDIAGIAVYRRSVLPENVDIPTGVVIQNDTVSGYTQSSTSDGFGIVVEGTNHGVTGNDVSGCDVGIQRQAGHTPYPGDGDQTNLADQFFGRGNSPVACGIDLSGNTLSANGADTRDVPASIATQNGFVQNLNTGNTYCTIQAAIDAPSTVNGHTIHVSDGTYNEVVLVNKEITLEGESTSAIIKAPYYTGGDGNLRNTVLILSNNVTLQDLTITRDYGVTNGDWNACTVDQGVNYNSRTNVTLRGLVVNDNRNGIFCNNAQGSLITECLIHDNRTGIQFGNNVTGLNFTNNEVRDNFTHGLGFNFDFGVMTLTNVNIEENSIANNWYSEVNFQRNGGSPGTNVGDLSGLDLSCNWYGTTAPTINGIAAGEPGYTSQVPSQFGGTDPGLSNRYLVGTHAYLIGSTYVPWDNDGADASASIGYQADPGACAGTPVEIVLSSVTNGSCAENADGSVYTAVSNGKAPYSFAWSGPSDPGDVEDAVGVLLPGDYTITVTDANGSVASVMATVGVTDVIPPTISCPTNQGPIAAAISHCYAQVYYLAPVSFGDNCLGSSYHYEFTGVTTGTGGSNEDASGELFNVGITTVTYTVKDASNNTASCSFTVEIIDNQSPTAQCPSDQFVNTDANVCTATLSGDGVAWPLVDDNCSPGPSATYTLTGATNDVQTVPYPFAHSIVFEKGTTHVEYLIHDTHGNTSLCSFDVTVNDNQAPNLTCPTDINAGTDALCQALVNTGLDATVSDNCTYDLSYELTGATTLGSTAGQLSSYPFEKGITTVTYTADDGSNTPVTCSFTVTVTDDDAPVIGTPAAIATCYPDNAAAEAAAVAAVALVTTDNCSAAIDIDYTTSTSGDCSAAITVTATDEEGNFSSVVVNTRVDNTLP